MVSEFGDKTLENLKDSLLDSINYLQEDLAEKYLSNHCSLVEEDLGGYEGCSITRKVYRESDVSEAHEEAKRAIFETVKKILNINNN